MRRGRVHPVPMTVRGSAPIVSDLQAGATAAAAAVAVVLRTAVGDDTDGDAITAHCQDIGIDVSSVLRAT